MTKRGVTLERVVSDSGDDPFRGRTWSDLIYLASICLIGFVSLSGASEQSRVALIALIALMIALQFQRKRYPFLVLFPPAVCALFVTNVFFLPTVFNLALRKRGWGSFAAVVAAFVLCRVGWSDKETIVTVQAGEKETNDPTIAWLVEGTVLVIAPFLAGLVISYNRNLVESYRVIAQHKELERQRVATEAVLRERARIANEAHDHVGHKLALLSLQAGGLEVNAEAGPDVIKENAQLIRETAVETLADLRVLIDRLDDASAFQAPEDLAAIVAENRRSGADITLNTRSLRQLDAMPREMRQLVSQVVQEALANASVHAPQSPISIELSGSEGGELQIYIQNSVREVESGDLVKKRRGTGLKRVERRVSKFGGVVRFGERSGRFELHVIVPWPKSVIA